MDLLILSFLPFQEGLEKIAEKVNPFWKDVFLNLSELKQEKGELVDILSAL
jgi:hypothetical protein